MLRIEHIRKSFGPVEVLKGISLHLEQGRLLGLVGENGAGKSTLMNILGGVIPASAGAIYLDGTAYRPHSARDAQDSGIAFIHQELNLFPNLSIAENCFISRLPRREGWLWPLVSGRKMHEQTRALLGEVGLDLSPETLVGDLTHAQQQLVEIAKALNGMPRLIIFDEPTTALSRHEAEQLFALIGKLRMRDIAMIYISHNLEDVLRLSDRIAVLRDGELVSTGDRTDYNYPLLVKQMVGRDLAQHFPAREAEPGRAMRMEVQSLSSAAVDQVSFAIHEGEILGFYGLVGAGRSELARALYGLDKLNAGVISWQGISVTKPTPADWIRKGVVFLTEDRRDDGLLLPKSLRQNIRLAALPRFARRFTGWIDYKTANDEAARHAAATHIRYRHLDKQEVSQLSGGNQQKVVLAKWLMARPQLLILDEPTKGIDIGAKEEIYRLIHELVAHGTSVLLISSEIEELLGLCDRILVLSNGRLKGEFDKRHFDRAAILGAALHASPETTIVP